MDGEPASSPPEKPSKVPSWIMLGFILGCLAMVTLQPDAEPPRDDSPNPAGNNPPPVEPPRENIMALSQRPSLAAIEAVFAQWGDYAVWDNDTTQVALWNSATGAFSDFLEVVRTPDGYYFRSIPRLTRPWTEARPPTESPLRFTEPEALQRARREGKLLGRELRPSVPATSAEEADLVPEGLPPPRIRGAEERP